MNITLFISLYYLYILTYNGYCKNINNVLHFDFISRSNHSNIKADNKRTFVNVS